MRIARKLTLLALAATAAMAFAASTASAQTVEVINEDTGAHCPALTATGGGCPVSGSGELEIRGHIFGIESTVTDCVWAFSGAVSEDGEGEIRTMSLSDHTGINDCIRVPCLLPWHVDVREGGGSTEFVEFEFCFESAGGGNRNVCHIDAPFAAAAGTHTYTVSYNDIGVAHPGGTSLDCEHRGSLSIVEGQNWDIEVAHTP